MDCWLSITNASNRGWTRPYGTEHLRTYAECEAWLLKWLSLLGEDDVGIGQIWIGKNRLETFFKTGPRELHKVNGCTPIILDGVLRFDWPPMWTGWQDVA